MYIKRLLLLLFVYCCLAACSKGGNEQPVTPDPEPPVVNPPIEPADGGLDTLGKWTWLDDSKNAVSGNQVLFWNADTGYVVNTQFHPSAGLKATFDGGKTWLPDEGKFSVYSVTAWSKMYLKDGATAIVYARYIPGNIRALYEPYYLKMDFAANGAAGTNLLQFRYTNFIQDVQYMDTTRYILERGGALHMISTHVWNTYTFNLEDNASTVYFTDVEKGWVGTESGKLFATTDRGKTWNNQLTAPTGVVLFDVTFADKNNGWIVTNSNLIYRTVNGGTTWDKIQIPGPAATSTEVNYYSRNIVMDSNTHGIINVGNAIYETKDGGATWQRSGRTGKDTIEWLSYDKKNTVWAATSHGLLKLVL